MMYLLFIVVPIGALLGWAARVDWKRRRREKSIHDIRAAELSGRRDAERKTTEWGAGA